MNLPIPMRVRTTCEGYGSVDFHILRRAREVWLLQNSMQFAQHLCADLAKQFLPTPPPKPTIPWQCTPLRTRSNKQQQPNRCVLI
jgi:hypothetical protein